MTRLDELPRSRSGAPDWSIDGVDWPYREHSAFYRNGAHIWHVQRFGQGPTALLLHGTGASTHSWEGLFPYLAERFEIIAVDLPGHAFTMSTDGFKPSLPNVASAVGNLIREMKIEPDLIVGHSAGAAIAIAMADHGHAEPKQLISINGALRPFDGAMRIVAPAAARLLSFGGLAASALSRSAQGQGRVEKLLRDTGSEAPANSVHNYATLMARKQHVSGTLKMMAHWDLSGIESACRRLSLPMMFVAGARDRAVPPAAAEEMAKIAPNGTHTLLNDLGHLAHEEAPDRIARIITDACTGM